MEFVFNKTMTVNEKELIENCNNSVDLLSKATILANHPFVRNVEDELQKIKEQEKEENEKAESEYEKLLKQRKDTGAGNTIQNGATKVGDK